MKKLDAYAVYLILEGAGSFFFSTIVTVNLVYQATVVGLSPLQLVLVGTVLESAAFLFEIPTGVVADVYSRRLSIIVGTIMIGAGFIVEGSIPHFWAVLVAQVIWGVGATFTSGATEAWISDEVGEERAGQAFIRGSQAGIAGALLGIPVSVFLGSGHIQWPIIAGGVLYVALGLFLAFFMPERGFTPTPREERTTWQHMQNTLREGLRVTRRRPVLITILVIGAIYGAFSEGFDRLWTPHMLDNLSLSSAGGLSLVAWFGLIRAVELGLAVVTTEVARRRVDTNSHRGVTRALLGINGLLAVVVAAFGLARSLPLALMAVWLVEPLRRIRSPLYTAWVNQRLDPSVRATIISMSSQADALGQIVGGPILGLIATAVSLRAGLVAAAVMLVPALVLYARTMRAGRVLAGEEGDGGRAPAGGH